MSSISNGQKQLLFDYSLGLTSERESAQAHALISSNEDAAEIYRSLEAALVPLESLEMEACPDDLVERTVARLVNLADSGHQGLEELLADEQIRPVAIKVGFWRNLSEMVAVAAAIMIIAGVLLPLFNRERQRDWKQRCQRQLSSIFQGLSNYVSDHDGRPPGLAGKAGQPWNTQCLYLPMKLGYINDSTLFICPGRGRSQAGKFDISRVAEYDDFPRGYVTYSPRKRCPDSLNEREPCTGPILSDRNPIFDNGSFSTFRRRLNQAILRANSKNHRGKGQNVLYDDGRVEFITIRYIGIAEDDIFALEDMGNGSEVDEHEVLPTCVTDIFLAP